ncbi:hypothetical protein [Okeania sp. SIO2B3]|uniref:hypothetical protein n=1 Tax=Okeania sp. SIO2B3 TaxID=2607784 RepID=UPI0013BFF7EF|nr:hypothetical protein [Okeania sp. SIO2B3]NET45377.1 hypothetical protein [Okeania sp. SIO2B3]
MDDYVYIPDDFDFSFLYDDDDPSWLDAIIAEIEQLEGFRVEHNELILKVWHYGTEAGACYHLGSHLDITPTLINELAKYDLDLEAFMAASDINYQLITHKSIKHPIFRPDLHLSIQWSKDLHPNDGYINGHYFGYHRNYYHGDYIELVYRHQIYQSNWSHNPDYLKPYFDAIWKEIQEKEIFRHPKEISLGSKVANYLPWGFKAYKVKGSAGSQCKIQRTIRQYCYLKKCGNQYYISPTEDWQFIARVTPDLFKAVGIALEMIGSSN